jgi:hypothetical protein
MIADLEKTEFNARAKAAMFVYLRSRSWPEKIRSIERMNAAARIARASMRKARAHETLRPDEGDQPVVGCD